MRGLTRLQRQVAEIVLGAAAPHGFVLAGGLGLVATGLSPRATEDINAFSSSAKDVRPGAGDVVAALEAAGFEVARDQSSAQFVRLLVVTGTARRRRQLKIELGRDHQQWPPEETRLGPVLSPRELAANKALALFSRVAPRDLCDIATLASRMDLEGILEDAALKDPGFDRPILAEMITMVCDRPDEEWPPVVDVDSVRAFGTTLAKALKAGKPVGGLQPETPIWPQR